MWGGASRSLADGLVSPMPWFCEGPWCSRSSSISTPGSGRCARPSGVPRGTATSAGSLASQRHPGKFPKVPGRSYMDVRVGL